MSNGLQGGVRSRTYTRTNGTKHTRWSYQFTVTENGERTTYTKGGFERKKDAQVALTEALRTLDRKERKPARPRRGSTLAEFVHKQWLPMIRDSGRLKPATKESYEWLTVNYLLPTLGDRRLSQITPGHLVDLFADLKATGGRNGEGLATSTVYKAAVCAQKIFKSAVTRGEMSISPYDRIDDDGRPSAKNKSEPGKPMQTWTRAQVATFMAATSKERLSIAWELFLGTGARRGEVAGLRWSDIDFESNNVRIHNNRVSIRWTVEEHSTKTDEARAVTLTDGLAAALKSWRTTQRADRLAAGPLWEGADHDYILTDELGRPVHPETLSKAFGYAAKRAKVSVIRLHDLRHTVATLLLSSGVSPKVVADQLGHSSARVTMDIYSHVTPELSKAAADTMAGIIYGAGR